MVLPQVWDFSILVEPYGIHSSPFPQPVVFPLDASTTLWCISHLCLFVINKLAVGALCPITQVNPQQSQFSGADLVVSAISQSLFPAHLEDSLVSETLLPEILVILQLSCHSPDILTNSFNKNF